MEAVRLAITRAVNGEPENFGGLYGDEAVVIQYVGDNPGRATVDRLLTPDIEVRWVCVERSQAELRRIKDLVTDDWSRFSSVAIDVKGNRVVVSLTPEADRAAVVESLAAYGEAVYVDPEPEILIPLD